MRSLEIREPGTVPREYRIHFCVIDDIEVGLYFAVADKGLRQPCRGVPEIEAGIGRHVKRKAGQGVGRQQSFGCASDQHEEERECKGKQRREFHIEIREPRQNAVLSLGLTMFLARETCFQGVADFTVVALQVASRIIDRSHLS